METVSRLVVLGIISVENNMPIIIQKKWWEKEKIPGDTNKMLSAKWQDIKGVLAYERKKHGGDCRPKVMTFVEKYGELDEWSDEIRMKFIRGYKNLNRQRSKKEILAKMKETMLDYNEPEQPEFDENCIIGCKPGYHVCGK